MRTWEEVREDFPILKEKIHGKDLIYLDNAATTTASAAGAGLFCGALHKV